MAADGTPWTHLSRLPVLIESYAFERLSAQLAHGFERVTTRVRLKGAGADGVGEDVSPFEGEDDTLHVAEPALALGGEWKLGSLCERLVELRDEQWPVPPQWEMASPVAQLGVRIRRARSRAQPGRSPAARDRRPRARARALRELARPRRPADVRPDRPPARAASRTALQARRHARLDARADGAGRGHRSGRDRRLQGSIRARDGRAGGAHGDVRAGRGGVPGRAARGRARPPRGHGAARAGVRPDLL